MCICDSILVCRSLSYACCVVVYCILSYCVYYLFSVIILIKVFKLV